MTEYSYYWEDWATGDGYLAPYNSQKWVGWWRKLFTSDDPDEGVIWNYFDELEVTAYDDATCLVGRGAAFVHGTVYELIEPKTLVLDVPTTNPRIDIIALQKDFQTQQVRLVVVKGTEAATPSAPSLTQSAGFTWEIPLAQIQVETDLSTTLTDARIRVVSVLSKSPSGASWVLDETINPSGSDQITFQWDAYNPPTVTDYVKAVKVIGHVRNSLGSTGYTNANVYIANNTTVGNYYNTILQKLTGATTLSVVAQAGTTLPVIPVLDGGNFPYMTYFVITLFAPMGEASIRNRAFSIRSGFTWGNGLSSNMLYQKIHTFYDNVGQISQLDIDFGGSPNFGAGSRVSCWLLK